MFIDGSDETSKCREGPRGLQVFYHYQPSLKIQTKVFMRGNAINKHLSVGFRDLEVEVYERVGAIRNF
jgi:hypothetical protein